MLSMNVIDDLTLQQAYNDLPEKYRDLFYELYVLRHKRTDVAHRLNMTVSNIDGLLAHIRKILSVKPYINIYSYHLRKKKVNLNEDAIKEINDNVDRLNKVIDAQCAKMKIFLDEDQRQDLVEQCILTLHKFASKGMDIEYKFATLYQFLPRLIHNCLHLTKTNMFHNHACSLDTKVDDEELSQHSYIASTYNLEEKLMNKIFYDECMQLIDNRFGNRKSGHGKMYSKIFALYLEGHSAVKVAKLMKEIYNYDIPSTACHEVSLNCIKFLQKTFNNEILRS